MLSSKARFETPNGSRYLQQLCKHFAHKVEVSYDAAQGLCALPPGPAELQADSDGLSVSVTAKDKEGLDHAKAIIDRHLERFAFREEFGGFAWSDSVATQ